MQNQGGKPLVRGPVVASGVTRSLTLGAYVDSPLELFLTKPRSRHPLSGFSLKLPIESKLLKLRQLVPTPGRLQGNLGVLKKPAIQEDLKTLTWWRQYNGCSCKAV